MKVKVKSTGNTEVGEASLPRHFYEPVRPDIIQRAVRAIQLNNRQPYGAKKGAGMRHSADLSKKRRDYRRTYGYGISRVPRKILSRRGSQFNWEGAIVSGTIGGRRAHPPKAEKDRTVKINKKENQKAIRSALAATFKKDIVEERGHNPPEEYPFVVEADIEDIGKTQKLKQTLEKLGFEEELKRTEEVRERSGKGKNRGRRHTQKPGLLIVVSEEDADVVKAANNLPGVEAFFVKNLNAEVLAPGTHPGRVTLFTDKAIDVLEEEEVFL